MSHGCRWVTVGVLGLVTGCASHPAEHSLNDPPRNAADAYANLGRQYLLQGSLDLAEARLKHAIQLDPDLAVAHHDLAVVYNETGNLEAAETQYRLASQLAPADLITTYNYATLLYNRGQYAEAETKFQTVAATPGAENRAAACEALGLIDLRREDSAKAEGHFLEALGVTPNLPRALLELSRITLQTGRFPLAQNYLQRHLEITHDTPAGLLLGIQIGKALENSAMGSDYTRRLRLKFPNSPEAQQLSLRP